MIPGATQYTDEGILRDINKAFLGFSFSNEDLVATHVDFSGGTKPIGVVTGKWGCGAFKNDPQLKFVQQWIASSLADRNMVFCGLNDPA